MKEVAEKMVHYARNQVYIDIVCDSCKTQSIGMCFRALIHHQTPLGKWVTYDQGCFGEDWGAAFRAATSAAEEIIINRRLEY